MELQTHRQESMSFIESVGVRAVIHPPMQFPIPYAQGFSIPTKFDVNVALQYTEIQHLGEPYKPCRSASQTTESFLYEGQYSLEVKHNFLYSQGKPICIFRSVNLVLILIFFCSVYVSLLLPDYKPKLSLKGRSL